jgi:putative lipoprotein
MRAALVLLLGLTAMEAAAAEITGTAFYRERIAPPPGSVFEAVLEDVSRADAPAVRLGAATLDGAEGPPYRFAIRYDPAAIDARMSYAVRATLRRPDGGLAFTSDAHHAVLTRGGGDSVEILMVNAGGAAAEQPADALTAARWRLAAMGDAPVSAEGQREIPFLVFEAEGAAYGSGGCNRLRTSWTGGAEWAIAFGPGATTMMACPEPAMRVEQSFLGALRAIESWRLEDGRLVLSAQGAPLLTFLAEPLE